MHWHTSWRFDPRARALADRHYNRQTFDSPQFVPPGRCLVLLTERADALWISSWPLYAQHEWAGAWVCTAFRNESAVLSSLLVREAVAATRFHFGPPPARGMITFVDPQQVRRKRDPGRCFLRAGWRYVGVTRKRGRLTLALDPADVEPPVPAIGAQLGLDLPAAVFDWSP